ncbi:unnamed protein product [Caenorhabditis brenneri]
MFDAIEVIDVMDVYEPSKSPYAFLLISKLQDYCAPKSVSTLEYTLQHTSHPTNSFRINGIFSNLKSFAEAFNCPVGSPMNPEKKCELLVEK